MERHSESATYDPIAGHYNFMRGDRKSEIEFYSGILENGQHSLLDVGCGTGVVTAAVGDSLAALDRQALVRITGIDGSENMLAEARKLHPSIEWLKADIRHFSLARKYDVALCCYNTLQHVPPGELPQALASIRAHLDSRGIFAFDIYQPNLPYLSQPQSNRMARGLTAEDGRPLEIREDSAYDEKSCQLTLDWRLADPARPAAPPLAATRFHMWQHFHGDVMAILEASGFAVEQKFGDLDRSPFTPSSRKQVLVCRAV